jgi:hypothetical protein
MIDTPPEAVAHADWSMHAGKRWVAVARRTPDGGYVADGPWPVGWGGSLLERMCLGHAPPASVLLGFDFPVGLPLAYAERAGIRSFPEALPTFGTGPWSRFFEVAATPEEICLHRPFYPRGNAVRGTQTMKQLVDGLRLGSAADLLRHCDRAAPNRSAACALFWTLGGNQVGKAALNGWREVLQPVLRGRRPPALWPFDGTLAWLLRQGGVVMAESYPTEFYGHLGVGFGRACGGGKRSAVARKANALRLLWVCGRLGVRPTDRLRDAIRCGFGDGAGGEDPFDATVGLLGMLNVVAGRRPPGEPADPRVRAVEGWILGQATPTAPG